MRSALGSEEEQCGAVSGTLDLTDKKCAEAGRDHVCCKRPDFRIKPCPVIDFEYLVVMVGVLHLVAF